MCHFFMPPLQQQGSRHNVSQPGTAALPWKQSPNPRPRLPKRKPKNVLFNWVVPCSKTHMLSISFHSCFVTLVSLPVSAAGLYLLPPEPSSEKTGRSAARRSCQRQGDRHISHIKAKPQRSLRPLLALKTFPTAGRSHCCELEAQEKWTSFSPPPLENQWGKICPRQRRHYSYLTFGLVSSEKERDEEWKWNTSRQNSDKSVVVVVPLKPQRALRNSPENFYGTSIFWNDFS